VGTVKLSSALLFDIGVYVTVVGIVLMAFEAFGDEDPDDASGAAPAAAPGAAPDAASEVVR